MMKRRAFLLFFILCSAILLVRNSSASCCANLNVQDLYCQAATVGECCPADGTYADLGVYGPKNVVDCRNKFYSTNNCESTQACSVGCCFDQGFGACIGSTKDVCLGLRGAQVWNEGFVAVSDRRDETNPCFNQNGVAAIPQCTQNEVSACSSFSVQKSCTDNGCFWCKDTCFANCLTCSIGTKDMNNDHVCDSAPLVDCGVTQKQSSKDACFNGNTNCNWCPNPPVGGLRCLDSCDSCPNPLKGADRVCMTGVTQCNDGIDNDRDNKIDLNDFCCSSTQDTTEDNSCSCSDKGHCCTLTAQCPSKRVDFKYYDKSSCSICCEDACLDIPFCDQKIQVKATRNKLAGFCRCGDVPVNTTSPDESDIYCCGSELSDSPCQLVQFTGTVKNKATGALIEEVELTLQGAVTYTFMNINPPGTFDEMISPGTYVLTAKKDGFKVFTTKPPHIQVPTTAVRIEYNVLLEQVTAMCNTDWPQLEVDVSGMKCKKDVFINWSFGCQDKVSSYEVYRGDILVARLPSSAKSFVDSQVMWEKTYDYKVVANILSKDKPLVESDVIEVSTGNHLCEGMCNGEFFCTSSGGIPNQLSQCTDQNQLESQACEDDSVCMSDAAPYCRQPDSCSNLGVPYPNVFGMFYDSAKCNSDELDNRRYCYYDNSETAVDSCKSCAPGMFCYDYQGPDACSLDNCHVTKDNRRFSCGWHSEINSFGELGKGICFAPGYNGTDYCQKCSSSSTIFENSHCSPTTCDLLGACYSEKNGHSCLACVKPSREENTQSPTKCSDYTDKRSCIGSSGNTDELDQPFAIAKCGAIPLSARSFTYSKDACGLGVCKWDSNRCIKDANDDGVDDCLSSDISCQKDSLPPETIVSERPEKVNYAGAQVKFVVQDYGWGSLPTRKFTSYYCIDSSNSCCPNLPFQDKIILKGDGTVPGLKGVSGLAYLRYFSMDGYKNIELIKSITLDVDTKPPRLKVNYEVQNNSQSPDASDLFVSINSSEPVFGCVDKLQEFGSTSTVSLLNDETIDEENGFTISRIYSGLEDGYYKYSINCTDSFGNTNSTVIDYITIDRARRIFDEAPVGTKFTPKQPVTISFQTVGKDLNCTVAEVLPVAGTRVRVSAVTQSQNNYRYSLQLGALPTGYYEYDISCKKNGAIVAKKTIFFLVDGLAPVTTLLYENAPGSFVPFDSTSYYQKLSVMFECDDPQIPGDMQPFGCAGTFYCTDIAGTCIPSTPATGVIDLSDRSESFMLVYTSRDAGANNESPKMTIVRVDRQGPEIEILSPVNGTIYNHPDVSVTATWFDNSVKADINILWYALQNKSRTKSLDFITSDKTFTRPVVLFKGENLVLVGARDVNVKGGSNSAIPSFITLFYDNIGPKLLYSIIKNNRNEKVNSPDKSGDVRYGRNLLFKLGVDDIQWTHKVRLARLSFYCANASSCGGFSYSHPMQGNDTSFNLSYDPLQSGVLDTGKYNVTYYAEDTFGNSNAWKDSFMVVDGSSINSSIFNQQGQRLDTNSGFAQYSRNILFQAKPSDFDLVSSVSLLIKCTDEYTCGSYQKLVAMARNTRSFNYTLVPRTSGILLPGVYNASFILLDTFGRTHVETLHFEVQDTSVLTVSISNHKGERIDNGQAFAQYSRRITFNVTPSDRDMFSSVKVLVVCQNQTACGNYRASFDTVRNGNSFIYVLYPQKGPDALYDPDIGNFRALFVMLDNFVVNRTVLRNFTIVDTEGPYIKVNMSPEIPPSIFNPFTGEFKVGPGINQCRWYKVVLDSNKPVVMTNLIADVFDFPSTRHPIVDFKNMPTPVVSPNRDRWSYKLCIPFASPVFQWLRGNNTRLRFTATDNRKILSTEENAENTFFEIDTHGGDPPILIKDVPRYTRNNHFDVVGFTNPREPNLLVLMNVSGMIYQTQASPMAHALGNDSLYLAASSGGAELEFPSDKSQLFRNGRFIEFSDSRHNGMLYSIVSSIFSMATGSTHVIINPPLENDVMADDPVVVYDSEKPTGYFQLSSTLPKEGNYTISIWAVDEFGNIGKKYFAPLLYLNRPVNITSYSPRNHDVFSNKNPNISVAVFDKYNVVNTSSIALTFNGTTYTCESGLSCNRDRSYLKVFFSTSFDLSDNKYFVSFVVKDTLGNSNRFSWDFTVDSRVPDLKLFKFVPGYYYPSPYDAWYANSATLGLYAGFKNGTIVANASLLENSSVKFACESDGATLSCNADKPVKDGEYNVLFSYWKTLVGGPGSAGQLTKTVIVDTKAPVLKFDTPYPSRRKSRSVSGSYNDSNLDDKDIIMVDGQDILAGVKATISDGKFVADVVLKNNAAEGNHTITAAATDKAGNIGHAQSVIIYDIHASPLVIVSVEPNDTSKTVVKINATYYAANVGTTTNGIKMHGYGEPGQLQVFTSYEQGNTTTQEVLQSTMNINSLFTLPATLFNANGKNFFRLVGTDLAGNNFTASLVIRSDTFGPEAPILEVEKSAGQMIPLGRTGTSIGEAADPSLCLQLTPTIAKDSCLINLLLGGARNVCQNITNSDLRAACDAMD